MSNLSMWYDECQYIPVYHKHKSDFQKANDLEEEKTSEMERDGTIGKEKEKREERIAIHRGSDLCDNTVFIIIESGLDVGR